MKKLLTLLTVTLLTLSGLSMFTSHAQADAGEGVGANIGNAGWSGTYYLKKDSKHQVWCLDFGKAEPMAGKGTDYSEPQKLNDVSEKDKKILIYALQEGEKAVKSGNKNLAAAVAAVIHASGVNGGKTFDEKTMVTDTIRADYNRIRNTAPEVPQGAYLTVRIPKDWKKGGSEGYQRVLDYDQVKFGRLEVTKSDAGNRKALLPGAEFQVRDMKDNVLIKSFESKPDGPYTIQLMPGTYKVIEGKAPTGFTLNGPSSKENTQIVTVDPNTTTQLQFLNRKIPELVVNKVDEAGKQLPGAKMTVTNANGDVVKEFTSSDKPEVLTVQPGVYSVTETESPEGYIKEEQKSNVKVDAGNRAEVTVVNRKLVPKIGTKAALDGTNIIKKGGRIVDTVSFTGLTPNKTYTLKAEMMCKENGQPTGNKGTTDFTPTKTSGEVNVEIPVEDDSCPIQTAFETLLDENGKVVAEHKDINDVNQTVGEKPEEKPKPAPKRPRVIIKEIPSGPTGNVQAPDIFPRG